MTDEQKRRFGFLISLQPYELADMVISREEEIDGLKKSLDSSHAKNNELQRAAGNEEQIKQLKDEISDCNQYIDAQKKEIEQLKNKLALVRNGMNCYKDELNSSQTKIWELTETANYYRKKARLSEKFIKKIHNQ